MDLPVTAFDIKGPSNDYIKLKIIDVYDFPDNTSFRGGYDVKCSLEISSGIYSVSTDNYYASTGALFNFYTELDKCYNNLNGKCVYEVYCAENDFRFEVLFNNGHATVSGSYKDDPIKADVLYFEFQSDQSYFKDVLDDLKKIVSIFGDNKGRRSLP